MVLHLAIAGYVAWIWPQTGGPAKTVTSEYQSHGGESRTWTLGELLTGASSCAHPHLAAMQVLGCLLLLILVAPADAAPQTLCSPQA